MFGFDAYLPQKYYCVQRAEGATFFGEWEHARNAAGFQQGGATA